LITDDEEDEIKVLNEQEVKRTKALNMIPCCFGKSSVTLKIPKTDLLPYRAWPKEKSYTFKVDKKSRKFGNHEESDIELLQHTVG
jgi:hypothetical protein